MHDLKALRSIFYLLCLFAVVMALLAVLVANGYTEHITPPADTAAEQVVKALGAHRYEAALDGLSEDLQAQVTTDDLRGLADRIESAHGGIEQANGEGEEESGDAATARVTVRLQDGGERELDLPLARENDLWKASSLDPLEQLAK